MQAQAIAQAGLEAAISRLDASAWRTTLDPHAGLALEAVTQTNSLRDYRANLAVMKTAEQMTGTLLDMKV